MDEETKCRDIKHLVLSPSSLRYLIKMSLLPVSTAPEILNTTPLTFLIPFHRLAITTMAPNVCTLLPVCLPPWSVSCMILGILTCFCS